MIRFLLGVLAGVAATVYFFQTGGGDYFLSSSTRVRHLEEQLQAADQRQDQLAKKLEEATAFLEKMTTKFTDLEQRFQALNPSSTQPLAEKPPASPTAPEAASPSDTPHDTTKESPSSTAPRPSSPGGPAASR